jgi:hypothetical protein
VRREVDVPSRLSDAGLPNLAHSRCGRRLLRCRCGRRLLRCGMLAPPMSARVKTGKAQNEHMFFRFAPDSGHRRVMTACRGMSRSLLNIEKRTLPSLTLRGVGLASKDAMV